MTSKDQQLYKIFGQNVRRFREDKKLSLAELSKISGIREIFLNRIETADAKMIKLHHLEYLCNALNVTPRDLLKL